jgi:hypothetical protein
MKVAEYVSLCPELSENPYSVRLSKSSHHFPSIERSLREN